MPITLIGGAIGATQKYASEAVSKTTSFVADTVTLRIDPAQVVKICIYAIIIFGIGIFLINVGRGLVIGMQQISCGVGAAICQTVTFPLSFLNPLVKTGQACNNNCSTENMPGYGLLYSEEWALRCLFYLAVALAIGVMIYTWFKFLFDKLLNIDREIAKFDNWIYGQRWMSPQSVENITLQ